MSQPKVEQQNATQLNDDKSQAGGTQATDTAAGSATDTAVEDPGDDVEKWKALSRKHEARAAANADKAKRFDELEEANKSEMQKLIDRTAAAEKRAVDAERKAFAASKGIPASLIHGTTEAEWEASAAAALEWKGGDGDKPKLPAAQTAAGQGSGTAVHDTKERSAEDIVAAARQR